MDSAVGMVVLGGPGSKYLDMQETSYPIHAHNYTGATCIDLYQSLFKG